MKIQEAVQRIIYPNPEDPELINAIQEIREAYSFFALKCVNENGDSVFCAINHCLHGYDEDGHNALGCHLETESMYILRFLDNAKYVNDHFEFFRLYMVQLYLFTEKLLEITKIVGLPETYRQKNLPVFGEIKTWTNFLKHPKAFILTHHPKYLFESQTLLVDKARKNHKNKILDFAFIKKYYSGEDKKDNANLVSLLANKPNIVLVLPDMLRLTNEFVASAETVMNLIAKNPTFQEILTSESTLKQYYSEDIKGARTI